MSWVDQGRQRHMWFGHGTAPDKEKTQVFDPSMMGKGVESRVLAIAHGTIAALPVGQRRQAEAQYHDGNLPRLKEAMTAWMQGFRLDQTTFAAKFFASVADDPVVQNIHSAVVIAATAAGHDDIREAAGKIAEAINTVGI